MPTVNFTAAARAEFLEAREWYQLRDPQLADQFAAEIDGVASRIETTPQQFPVVLRDVRRARCQRFPYSLFFRVVDDTAYVIACFHGSRDPRRWQRLT